MLVVRLILVSGLNLSSDPPPSLRFVSFPAALASPHPSRPRGCQDSLRLAACRCPAPGTSGGAFGGRPWLLWPVGRVRRLFPVGKVILPNSKKKSRNIFLFGKNYGKKISSRRRRRRGEGQKSPSGRGAGEVGRKQKEKLCFPGDLFGVEICNFSLPQRIYDCFMFCIEKNIVLIES